MKHLNFERVESFDINHTFFFTTEKSNMRIDYTSLTNIINAYNGEITIYPTYSLDGEDVRMEGIKGDSPALYVAIMDSVIKYCEAAGKDKNTEKEIINILCVILHLSNDRDEAIATLSEYVDMYDSESDVPNLEDSQELKDNLFMHDTHIQEVMRQAMKPKIKKEVIAFEEWEDTVSVSRYIHRIESEAFLYFNDAVKIDGSVLADMYIDSACEDSAIVSEVVTSENISHFISNALDDLEEDLDDRLLSSASIVLSIDKKKYKFDVTHVLYGIYEDEMLASGYTEEEIEEVNEVEF